jgi:hypothetical protein
MSASNEFYSLMITELKFFYKVDESAASQIYNASMKLYHELNTLLDLRVLNNYRNEVLFGLMVAITHYYSFDDMSK